MIEVALMIIPKKLLPREFQILDQAYQGRLKWQAMLEGDDYLGYHYKPNLDVKFPSEGRIVDIKTTSYGLGEIGFRDIGNSAPYDVVAVGDSFTFCDDVGGQACWLRELSQLSGASIADLGVSGYSTLAEARVFERYGRRLKPRVVMVAIFPNDFNDNIDFEEWTKSGTPNFWEWRGKREGRGPVLRWFADRSKIIRMVDGALRTHGRYIFHYKTDKMDLVFQPWWMEPMDEERRQQRAQGWALMEGALRDVKRMADEQGARMVVVTIPTKEEVYFDYAKQVLPKDKPLAVDQPFGPVRDFCQATGAVCCDITPAMKDGAARSEQLYLRVSSHWNEKGHAVGAKAVYDCMKSAGVLPLAPAGG